MMKMPQVKSEYFSLGGGLDLLTPAIALAAGKCLDAQNYEPEIGGGYRRIDGYERFDGRTKPSAAPYHTITINLVGAVAVGNTITGVTSAATTRVLAVVGTTLVLGRMTGTFVVAENFTVAAVVQGSITSAAVRNGATTVALDADYVFLAANDRRTDILVVPGSGRIRGVAVYNDLVHAFRDNAAGTAGDLYKESATGWVKVNFGSEIQFTAGLAAGGSLIVGNTINGGTSAATAVIVKILVRSGSFAAGNAAGTFILSTVTGTFANGEAIRLGATAVATAASASTAIVRAAGGLVETVTANFTGSTATSRLYGADGVNPAFEFDGTNYIPIRTGMTPDNPLHVMDHRNYLFLSFLGSVQFSGIGNPYAWTAVLGSGEIATGAAVTGFLPQGGNQSGSSLVIFTQERTYVLYGSGSSTFQLVDSSFDVGYSAYTMQPVGNTSFGLTSAGVQNLSATQAYGNFAYTAITKEIQSLMTARRGMECASTVLRTKDQYRLYFNDGTALAIGLSPDQSTGSMPLNYGKPVRCVTTESLSTGVEVTYFGSDDGYVYQDNTGTSLDGAAIEAWVRLPFNHNKSPRTRKRYRRAVIEARVVAYAQVAVSYDLGYGSPDVLPSTIQPVALSGAGGYWEQFIFDQFAWDAQIITDANLSIDGTEKNISLLFYSMRAQDKSHVLQGVTLSYSLQRSER